MKNPAKKVIIDGIKFDSGQEGRRYTELKLAHKNKQISSLVCHPEFLLQAGYRNAAGKKIQPMRYTADFSYWRDGERIIEDVKPHKKGKKGLKPFLTEPFRMRRKLFENIYPYVIKIVK